MKQILVVEDNADLAFGLRSNLELEGYCVAIAPTGPAGLEAALQPGIDLIILDVMLPQLDGYDVLQQIRDAGLATPVLMLTARGEEFDKVRGLRSGADDYVTKPFALMELLARIEALLRRGTLITESGSAQLRLGPVSIDSDTRTVMRDDKHIDLSPKEFDLLVELLRHRGNVASRTALMKAVWGHSAAVVSRTVDTHIAELRRKLGDTDEEAPLIVTVRKAGYRVAL